jgi:UDP-N-acetylmuramate dehydrogenase
MDAHITYRKNTQPPGASLGSVFKNPPGDYAGRLIESAGLKGYRVGGVMVSPVHANFFVNTAGATAGDYYALIRHVQETVQRESGILLELEIELLGDFL